MGHKSQTGAVIIALNTAEPASRTSASIYDLVHILEEHDHSDGHVYPTLAAGAVLAAGDAAPWTQGDLTEIIPASTVTSPYDIHYISIESLSAVAVYELELFHGASNTHVCSIRFTKTAVMDGTQNVRVMGPVIAANDKITGKLASSSGDADTATVALFYHTY